MKERPPPISDEEQRLSRRQRCTLSQLRSGHCHLLQDYKHRVIGEPSDICTDCGASPQDVRHLFACTTHPTDLSPEDPLCVKYDLRKGATSEAGKYRFRADNVWWKCVQYFVIGSCGKMHRDNRCMYMAYVCFYVCCSDCVGFCGNFVVYRLTYNLFNVCQRIGQIPRTLVKSSKCDRALRFTLLIMVYEGQGQNLRVNIQQIYLNIAQIGSG